MPKPAQSLSSIRPVSYTHLDVYKRQTFTPDGTGTVVDNATDEDGKEFYTITTADELSLIHI